MGNAVGFMAALLFFLGCEREGVRVYRAPKERGQQSAEVSNGHRTDPLRWVLPQGWEEAQPGPMRAASFVIKGADGQGAEMTIVPLAGDGGGELGNLNRWRAQVGLPPVREEEVDGAAEAVDVGGQRGRLFDVAGAVSDGRATRLIAAMTRRGGRTWFFKMMGDDAFVAGQKQALVRFLESIQYAD